MQSLFCVICRKQAMIFRRALGNIINWDLLQPLFVGSLQLILRNHRHAQAPVASRRQQKFPRR